VSIFLRDHPKIKYACSIKNILLFVLLLSFSLFFQKNMLAENKVNLLPPSFKGKVSLGEALKKRRSRRNYTSGVLTLKELSQLLWAGYGVTAEWGAKTAPSAGALYPLRIYIVAGEVDGLSPGIYKYEPDGHFLVKISDKDKRLAFFSSALNQSSIKSAPLSFVICADFQVTTERYGPRGKRYVFIEAGHVSQNIYLQAEALNLATVAIGAFEDEKVKNVLGVNDTPLYIMPVGKR